MKKLIYFTAFFLAILLTASCSSDSDGGSSGNTIVGNWKSIGYTFEGEFEPSENEPCDDSFVKFNKNKTGVATSKYCDEPTDTTDFTWKNLGGSTYSVTTAESGVDEFEIVFSDNNKKMTLYDGDTSYGGVYQRM